MRPVVSHEKHMIERIRRVRLIVMLTDIDGDQACVSCKRQNTRQQAPRLVDRPQMMFEAELVSSCQAMRNTAGMRLDRSM